MKYLVAIALAVAAMSASADELSDVQKLKGDAARGKAAFVACQRCHGANAGGRRDGAFPRLAGQYAAVLVKQLVDIRAGRRDNPVMHPYITAQKLAVQDIADLGAYLEQLPVPAGNGRGPGKNLAEGAKLYAKNCQDCHGRQAEGDDAAPYPMLAGQHYRYLVRQIRDIRDGVRKNANPLMRHELAAYDDPQVELVADYVSRLPSPAPGAR